MYCECCFIDFTLYGEVLMPTLRAQIALSEAFDQSIVSRLLETPKGTVGPEGASSSMVAHGWFSTERAVVPDMVLDVQSSRVLRIPSIAEHGDDIN